MRLWVIPVAAVLGAAACGSVSEGGSTQSEDASDYPSHPVNWVVPYEPGGGSDTQVRRLQPYVEESLGQRINIVYKPGGDGAAGWEQMHSATPDGYTIGNVVSPNIMQLALTGKAGFKPGDFEYVTWTEEAPSVIAVAKNSRFASMDQFVEEARANPGKVTLAGVGETNKIDAKQVEKAIDAKLTYVPVSGGSGPISQQLQGGHIDASIESTSGILERSDALKALAVANPERSEALPDVPTFEELGYEGWRDVSAWGVICPPGTPDSIVKKLNKAVNKAVEPAEVQEKMTEAGLTPLSMTPDEAAQRMKDDLELVKEEVELGGGSG